MLFEKKSRAARLPRTAPGFATLPQPATDLGGSESKGTSSSRQDALDRVAQSVEAARAGLAAMVAEDQHNLQVDQISALAAVVTVLRMSERSLSPKEAAFIVGRTEPTVIAWCRCFHIGAKLGGRWIVDPLRLAAMLLGCAS